MNSQEIVKAEKKSYTAPQIVYKQKLEAMAIVCTNLTPPSKAVAPTCDAGQLFS